MWPFKRKYPPVEQLVITEAWTVGHGSYKGRPLITRVNAGLRSVAGHPRYRYQAGVAVPFKSPTDAGLPTAAEDEQLAALEDELTAALQGRDTLFAAILTTGDMREFVFYTSEPQALQERVATLRERVKTHQIQLMIQEDPRWSVFRNLLSS